MQLGGVPKQQSYPDFETWQAAMDSWMMQMTPSVQKIDLSAYTNTTLGDIPPETEMVERPKDWSGTSKQWYDFTTTQGKKKSKNPYSNLQNLGLGLKAFRTGIGEIAGSIERGRQNQYDYTQQTALGMMNPMQSDDFQPNPYNLYMEKGGNLKSILRDFNKFSNNAQMDMGDGKLDDKGMMKKGGYEIDRMLIVRKLLPELLKLGRLGSAKYRNYKKGGCKK